MVFIHESKCIENEQVLVKAGNKQVNFFEAESRYRAKRKLIVHGWTLFLYLEHCIHRRSRFK